MNTLKQPTRESIRQFYNRYESKRRGELMFIYKDRYGLPINSQIEIFKKFPIRNLTDKECDETIEHIINLQEESQNDDTRYTDGGHLRIAVSSVPGLQHAFLDAWTDPLRQVRRYLQADQRARGGRCGPAGRTDHRLPPNRRAEHAVAEPGAPS